MSGENIYLIPNQFGLTPKGKESLRIPLLGPEGHAKYISKHKAEREVTVLEAASGALKVHYIFTEGRENKVNSNAILGGPMKSELTKSRK